MKKLLLIALLALSFGLIAQNPPGGGDPGDGGGGPTGDPDTDTPIDGGIEFVVLGAVAIGARYLYKKRENK